MKAYSTDLRERVILSVESGECTVPAAAKRYQVSEPSIERWLARKRMTGSCAPLPHAGGVPRKLAAAEAAIRATVKAQPLRNKDLDNRRGEMPSPERNVEIIIKVGKIHIQGNPDVMETPCACGSTLVYQAKPLYTSWNGYRLEVESIWGYRCNSRNCSVVLLLPEVSNELERRIDQSLGRHVSNHA